MNFLEGFRKRYFLVSYKGKTINGIDFYGDAAFEVKDNKFFNRVEFIEVLRNDMKKEIKEFSIINVFEFKNINDYKNFSSK